MDNVTLTPEQEAKLRAMVDAVIQAEPYTFKVWQQAEPPLRYSVEDLEVQ